MQKTQTTICIVGAGPAGMVLALQLAKKGIDVVVLEKNKDFEREFRGEVLQPRFMHTMEQIGLLDVISSLPQEKFDDIRLFYKGKPMAKIGVKEIDPKYPYVMWMTQPILLEGLRREASKYDNFHIEFSARVSNLLFEDKKCAGVSYKKEGEEHQLSAKVVVGADGRFSKLRQLGNFKLDYHSHDFDVMWFEMIRPESYTHGADFFLSPNVNCLILPKYPNKIQCGLLVKAGSVGENKKRGASWIAAELKKVHPMFESFADKLIDFNSFTVLEAKIEMLQKWASSGLLMIGDAAHTCSPAGAIGVSVAVETAVVAASVLTECCQKKDFSEGCLSAVKILREKEVRKIHSFQRRGASLAIGLPFAQGLFPIIAKIGVSLGVTPRMMAKVLTRSKPLALGL